VVGRAAAVLGPLAAAQAYVLLAPELPLLHPEDLSLFVAAFFGLAAVYACAAVITPMSDVPPLLVLVAVGAIVLVAAFNVAEVGAAATPVEAIAYAAFGALFALALLAPSLALALPVFVAAIDAISTLAGGPSEILANAGQTEPGDPLSLELPDWGNGLPAGRLGIADAVFAGVFLCYARRFGLRPRATAVGLWVAAVAAVGLKLWLDVAIPVLPLMAAAYFLVNADRLPRLFRLARQG
jgi:hypothetical protein